MTRKRHELTDREKTLNNFVQSYDWAPHWGAEVTSAVEGLEHQVLEAERFGGSSATVSTVARGDVYRTEAHQEAKTLATPIIETKGLYPVKFEMIHSDRIVVNALARHLLFRHAFTKDKWPTHSEPSIDRKAKPFLGSVKNLSRTKREGLWLSALQSERDREIFWTLQLMGAHSNPTIASSIETYNQNKSESKPEAA